MSNDGRYPYTYACDLIRSFVGPNLSRSEASQIMNGIAGVLGVEDRAFAEMLADRFLENQDAVAERFLVSAQLNKRITAR